MSSPVQVIAEELVSELGLRMEDGQPPREAFQVAQAILFALGKHDMRLVLPEDLLRKTVDREAGTVTLKLRLEE